MNLLNTSTIVTGAGGRIGFSVVKTILESGGNVALVDIKLPKLNIDLGEKYINNLHFINCDVTNADEISKAIESTIQRFGKIDSAVHAAYPRSEAWGTKFENLTIENLALDLKMQLGSAIIFSQKIIKYFQSVGSGNLIHLSSIQGIAAPKFEHYEGTKMVSPIEYSAIKAGIISITKYLAKLYKKQGIRVNCIAPGGILDNQPEIFLNKYNMDCNFKGMLEGNDLSGTIRYLLSNDSKFLTGQTIVLDDGWSL